jgi:DNA-binding MarR family transcriptional regulator
MSLDEVDGVLVDPEELDLAEQLTLVISRLGRQMRQTSNPGLTPTQLGTLCSLERSSMTLGELAAAERVQPPTMTVTVDRLEAQGLARRSPDRVDRRVVRVELTPAGRRILTKRRTSQRSKLARRLDTLTKSQRATLTRAVELLHTLAAGEDWDSPTPPATDVLNGSNVR